MRNNYRTTQAEFSRKNESLIIIRVLVVDDELKMETARGRATRAIVAELHGHQIDVIESASAEDANSIILSNPALHAILLDWSLDSDPDHEKATRLINLIRERNAYVPIFLMGKRTDEISSFTAKVTRKVDELIYSLEDTSDFIAGRVLAAIRRYLDKMPAFTKALFEFAQKYEYSWHTPGHAGGTAFLKSPVGRAFHDCFGENLLRSDLSVSVDELGSLLSHKGAIGESEKYAAGVFGADRSYTVTNGSSTSNRVIFMACVARNDIALVDRNCHKSLEHALTLTGAIPVYLLPSRNYLGIIGPISPRRLMYYMIQKAIDENELIKKAITDKLFKNEDHKPCHSVITNSTYDGLCYNARRVVELLGQSVDRIHFDEAWYGYARFNDLYEDRFGMYGDLKDYQKNQENEPTIFTTTSTHKMLAALSQASFIHVRYGRDKVEHERFNESFMMYASTSPQYAIICSNEVSAAMMKISGDTLTTESIQEAVAFRLALRRIRRDYKKEGEWFFSTWNADEVTDPITKKQISFEDASQDLLVKDSNCWVLHPGEKWHGFGNLFEDGYCMLDPIKVSVVTPGVATDGSFEKPCIPAKLVTAYLDHRGIVVEKTNDFTILFLFSIGITKGKWVTLVNALLKFKDDYDNNAPLDEVLPELVKTHPDFYGSNGIQGLHDLADKMFEQMKKGQLELQKDAFLNLPTAAMTPNEAYQKLVHNEVEPVKVEDMADRIVATGVVPYPPGIPMLMPGENAGAENGPYLSYLSALLDWDDRFPGFSHEIHGVEKNKRGEYQVYCLKQNDKGQQ